jgi:hypothetical protein
VVSFLHHLKKRLAKKRCQPKKEVGNDQYAAAFARGLIRLVGSKYITKFGDIFIRLYRMNRKNPYVTAANTPNVISTNNPFQINDSVDSD